MLWAVFFTLAAFDAVGGCGRCFSQGSTLDVLDNTPEPAVVVTTIVSRKGARNINALWARHTVSAAGAAHLHAGIDGVYHIL